MSGPSWTLSVPYGADQTVYLVADRGCRCCRIRPQQVTTTTLVLTHNLVIQEIFSVNHHIRAVCDRWAGEGYVAIAPAIFDRVEPNFTCGYSPDEIAVARARPWR
jgi:dienelactone hydrolase